MARARVSRGVDQWHTRPDVDEGNFFGASNELYFIMIAVDAVMQNLWLALLLFGVRSSGWLDRMLKADPQDLATIQQAGFEKESATRRM